MAGRLTGAHLYVVHTVPQSFEGRVHHFSLPSPLLQDAAVLEASDQVNHPCPLLRGLWASCPAAPTAVVVSSPHHGAHLPRCTHHLLEDVHHVAVLRPVPVHHQHHLQAGEGEPADTSQALPEVVRVLLVGGDAESHGAAQVLRPGEAPHPPVLQGGEEALQEQVEGQESAVEAEGQVVLLRVDELVAWEGQGPFSTALGGRSVSASASVPRPGVAGLYL